jgi:large subunit ribosomal protein L9
MNVILLEKLPNLGEIGTVVKVKAGYARNYLLPTHKAQVATPENIKEAQDRNAELLKSAEQKLKQAQTLAKKLSKLSIEILAAADDEGHLYGSVGIKEIVDFLVANDFALEKKNVALAEGAFKTVGIHQAQILLHPEVNIVVNINITKEKAESSS